MKRRVYVLDSELSPFGVHADHDGIECAGRVVATLMQRHPELWHRIDWMCAGAARMGRSDGRENGLAQSIALRAGLRPPAGFDVHAFCATGHALTYQAVLAIEAGRAEVALVVGVDHSTAALSGPLVPEASGPEINHGYSPAAMYALCAERYLETAGAAPEALAQVAVRNRRNGAGNPLARFQSEVTVAEVLASRPIAGPLTLLQCCSNADGAGAALLVSKDAAHLYRLDLGSAVDLNAIAMASAGPPENTTLLSFAEDIESSHAAYEEAGVGPDDLDVLEVHDAFTISQVIHLEDLGLARRGEGWRQPANADAPLINPSGGLLSRGHPLGATGIAQIHAVRTSLIAGSGRIGLIQGAGGIQSPGQMLSACVVLGTLSGGRGE